MQNAISGSLPAVPITDVAAFLWFMALWAGYTLYADRTSGARRPAAQVIHDYRVRWMGRLLQRENRMADVSIVIAHMRAGILFSSISILLMAGVMAILGNLAKARELTSELSFAVATSREMWEIKVIVLLLIFVYAFFKYVWCIRQFNFSLVFIGAAPLPEDVTDHDREDFPKRGANLFERGIVTFNRGLRAYYFGLAMLSWFIGPVYLAVAAVWVVAVLFRRDFHSLTLQTLIED